MSFFRVVVAATIMAVFLSLGDTASVSHTNHSLLASQKSLLAQLDSKGQQIVNLEDELKADDAEILALEQQLANTLGNDRKTIIDLLNQAIALQDQLLKLGVRPIVVPTVHFFQSPAPPAPTTTTITTTTTTTVPPTTTTTTPPVQVCVGKSCVPPKKGKTSRVG